MPLSRLNISVLNKQEIDCGRLQKEKTYPMVSAVFNARVHEYDFSFVPSELDALKKQQRVLCEKFKEDKGGQFRFTQFFGFLILLATDQ